MRQPNGRTVWLSTLLVTVAAVLLLADTERRYLHFLGEFNEIETSLRWERSVPAEDEPKLTLRFKAGFDNQSSLPMVVEALNTQFYIDGEYAGAFSIAEGSNSISPNSEASIPLEVVLWERRRQMLRDAADATGTQARVEGRARVRWNLETSKQQAFYNIQGTFPVATLLPAESTQQPSQRNEQP